MSIGYASKTLAAPGARMQSVVQRLATPDRLAQAIDGNLRALDAALDYQAKNGIHLFRISSDVIPFGSSPVNALDWMRDFEPHLAALGRKARRHGIRLSMHPGQYTVLNSPDAAVVERAKLDLAYHAAFLDALGMDASGKIVLHVGGAYGDKPRALERFANAYATLPLAVRRRLVIENDDRLFTAQDVLALSRATGAPMVFDTLHHELNREPDAPDWRVLLDEAAATWKPEDGAQKMHYAQQAPGRRPGSHTDTIELAPFLAFYRSLAEHRTDSSFGMPDIMLEVKDKNLSAIKCILCTSEHGRFSRLEREWARYKYAVLEHDQAAYLALRALLKDKRTWPTVPFYEIVERALAAPVEPGSFRNAAQHVWGYVAPHATAREHAAFERLLEHDDRPAAKRKLHALAEKYDQPYLLESYYFVL